MPKRFTDEMVTEHAERLLEQGKIQKNPETMQERREVVARYSEERYQDYVEGWEVRTGRPWTEMTKEEAEELCMKHPQCRRNPGVLSRLLQR